MSLFLLLFKIISNFVNEEHEVCSTNYKLSFIENSREI